MPEYLSQNEIYLGRSEELIQRIKPESIALSLWSPPYFVGKKYEKDETLDSWQQMLCKVIKGHSSILKHGGFMVVNMDDILCFPDKSIPRFQADNPSLRKCKVSKEDVLQVQAEHPDFNRVQIASILNCSEQTVDRRLHGNNVRGGKSQTQTRVKLIGGMLEALAYEAQLYLYDRRIWLKDPAWANSQWTSNTLKAVSEYEHIYIFWKPGQQSIDRTKLTHEEWSTWGLRQVWNIPSVRANNEHEAMFPQELAQRIIRLFSDEGETILDPFMGSGTSALAALDCNRSYVGFEKEEAYVELAKRKIDAYISQPSLF